MTKRKLQGWNTKYISLRHMATHSPPRQTVPTDTQESSMSRNRSRRASFSEGVQVVTEM